MSSLLLFLPSIGADLAHVVLRRAVRRAEPLIMKDEV